MPQEADQLVTRGNADGVPDEGDPGPLERADHHGRGEEDAEPPQDRPQGGGSKIMYSAKQVRSRTQQRRWCIPDPNGELRQCH
jgi:hypothetical protein